MKKLKFLVGAVALFALVVVNVWNAATTINASDLDVSNVESIAEAENDFFGYTGTRWDFRDLIPIKSEKNYYGCCYNSSEVTYYNAKYECVDQLLGNARCKKGDIGYGLYYRTWMFENGVITRTEKHSYDPDGNPN